MLETDPLRVGVCLSPIIRGHTFNVVLLFSLADLTRSVYIASVGTVESGTPTL